MSAHSRLSPSRMHRVVRCPGSVREESKYPEQPSGPAAIDGTHTHTLLEACVVERRMPEDFISETLTDHEGTFKVDHERASRVRVAIDYIQSRIEALNNECEVYAEQRVDPEPFVGRDDMSGTVDVQILSDDMIEIIDYKDGMSPTDAREQMEIYALGALANSKVFVQRVRLTVIQPKLSIKGMEPITTVEMTADELRAKAKFYRDAADTSDVPDAPLSPGDSQCKFCRAKGGCSALATQSLEKAGISFQAIDVAQQSADKNPTEMTDQQLREVLEAAPLLRQLLEAVEKEAQRRIEAGRTIPGLKLVNGRGSRKWALPEEEMATRLVKLGIPKGAIYTTSLVSPAQAEKLTWEKRDGTRMQLSERQLKVLEKEYVTKLAGKPTVALEADARVAVVTDASNLFTPVVEQPKQAESLPAWLM